MAAKRKKRDGVRKRKGSLWYTARFIDRYGRSREITLKGVDTRAEAIRIRKEIIKKEFLLKEGLVDDRPIVMLKDWLEGLHNQVKANPDGTKSQRYKKHWVLNLIWSICGDIPLHDVDRLFVTTKLIPIMEEEYKNRNTRSDYLSIMSMFFKDAHLNGLVDRNPFVGLIPSRRNKEAVMFTENEIKRLVRYLTDESKNLKPVWRAFFLLLLNTGMRRDVEAQDLKWSEVNTDERYFLIVGKRNKRRRIYMNDGALQALSYTSAYRQPQHEYVFVNTNGEKYSSEAAPFVWRKIRKAFGMEKYTLHDCRRNFASWYIRRPSANEFSLR